MKKQFLLILALLSVTLFCNAKEIIVGNYYYAGPFQVQTPLLIDTVNNNNQSFSEKELLKTNFPFTKIRELGKSLTLSSENYVLIPSGQDKYSLHLLSFYINNSQYQKASLKIKAPEYQEIYIDNELQKPVNGQIELSFEPRQYKVIIKYLSTANRNDSIQTIIDYPSGEGLYTTLDPTRTYLTKDVMEGKRVQSAQISPDGNHILIHYSEIFPGGDQIRYGQIIDRSSGKVLMLCDGEAKNAQWMPKSNAIYYTRRGMKGKELVKVHPVSGQENILSENLPDGSFRFSPTEEYLLYTVQEKGPEEKKETQEVLVPDDRQPGWRNRNLLHIYDLNSGLFQRLTYGYHSTYLNDISPDGQYVLVSCREPFLTERPFSRTTLYLINVRTMHTDTLMSHAKFINRAQFSPDGKQLLVSASGDAFEGIGLNINSGQISNTSDGQLFLYNLTDKKVTPLTKDFNPSVDKAVWNRTDNTIYLLAKDKDLVKLYTIHPEKKTIIALPTQEDVIADFDISSNANELVYYGMSASNSQRLYQYNLKKNSSSCLVDLSKDLLKDIRLGEVKDWNFVSEAGDTIYGRYYLPPGFDSSQKYPLIVNYYGGTTPTARVLESRYPSHVYAGMGYVVYIVQPSGATGFGQEFSARHVNAWGKQTADEIIEGTIRFCEEHSFINKEKVGCMGASYGGFMTMYLQTKTDIFAAAMSHAGISDITSYWGEGYWGYSYSALATADSYPWNARDIYVEQSPLFHADKINTPILFLHGAVDTNVPVGESIQMFTALKLLGKPTAFVQVPDQDHHILDYDKRIRWNHTIFAWFAKWLKNEPEWWDALYPPKSL